MGVTGGHGPSALSADRVASAPRRQLTGRFWHQGPTRYPLGSFADPATTDGRYHRGGQGVWYASDREQAAWAELLRHFTDDGVDPLEVRRRVGAVDVVRLQVLDLTDERVRSSLGVSEQALVGDEYAISQQLAGRRRKPASRASWPPRQQWLGGARSSFSRRGCPRWWSAPSGCANRLLAWRTS